MKRIIVILVMVLSYLMLCASASGEATAKGGTGGKSTEGGAEGGKGGDGTVITKTAERSVDEIKRLIRDLDSDDINVRDEATEELKKIGRPALPYLEEATKSDSPEVAWRSKIIIRTIEREERKKQAGKEESPDERKIGPALRNFPNRFSITIQGAKPGTKSFSFSQDTSGKITVTITEYDKDGKEKTQTYTANSTEEFKQKYPDIAKEYGIGVQIEIPDIDIEDIWKDFGRAWSKQLDDLRKEIDKLREGARPRWFNPFQPQPPKPEDKIKVPQQEEPISPTDLGLCVKSLEDSPLSKELDIDNGIVVVSVDPDGLGRKIGLKKDDVIVAINDIAVATVWQSRRLIKTSLEKGSIKLTIIRDGKKMVLTCPK
jgi:uncharacterized protein YxeA